MESFSTIAFLSLFILLVLSMFFSANETAYSSLNRIRLKHMAEKGSKGAVLALVLHEDFNKLLSTLLIGNNIVNLSMASICAVLFAHRFGDIGATISTVVLTIVVIIFADVTPKVLAKGSPERVAQVCAPVLRFFMILFAPFNYFFERWKQFLKIIFKSSFKERVMSEEELMSIVSEAEQEGVIDSDDSKLLHNALEFYDQQARDILTPRIDVVAISRSALPEEISAKFLEKGLSRLPVYDGSVDNIVGVLHMRDFFAHVITPESYKVLNIDGLMTPPVFVAALTSVGDLFKQLQKEKSHFAVVSDEYGGTEGIVTMEDILEELVGEIWDEADEVVEKFTNWGNNKYRVLCTTSMDDFYEYFHLPGKKPDFESPTVGGWIVDMLGKIPEKGDTFTFGNLTVIVHKTQHRRALECIVKVNEKVLQEV